MGSSAGYLPKNGTSRPGNWEKGGLYTSGPSKFKFSLERKQNIAPHVLGPLHFLPLLPSLKIPPSITRGGFLSKLVLFTLKAEAMQVLGRSENDACVYLLRGFTEVWEVWVSSEFVCFFFFCLRQAQCVWLSLPFILLSGLEDSARREPVYCS